MDSNNVSARQQNIVWWVLWGSFVLGVCFIYHFLNDHKAPAGTDATPLWLTAFVPVLLSAIIRWILLPRLSSAQQALPFFILGIALAESATFLGLFIFPRHRLDLFILSVLGIVQFAPFFATRWFPRDRGL